jgi:hypothetical protein
VHRVAQQIIETDRRMFVVHNTTLFAGVSTSVTGVRLATNGNVLVANARFTQPLRPCRRSQRGDGCDVPFCS